MPVKCYPIAVLNSGRANQPLMADSLWKQSGSAVIELLAGEDAAEVNVRAVQERLDLSTELTLDK